MPPKAKLPPPKGYTGHDGLTPSYADVHTWAQEWPGDNLALRLPDGVIGIDVDAYEPKTGAATLCEAEKCWGALPPSYRSTSRTDGVSGVRLYQVPPGTMLRDRIALPEQGIGDVEIVQRHHRYVLAWPSVHPTGAVYRWYADIDGGELDTPPALDDLPRLPDAWLEALRVEPARNGADLAAGESYEVRKALTGGVPSNKVSARLQAALSDLRASRHDHTRDHALALLRYGEQGEPGVRGALETLMGAFVGAVTADESRTRDEAVAEFRRMIFGKRVGQLLATPLPSNVEEVDELPAPQVQEMDDGTAAVIHSAHLGMAVKLAKQFRNKLLYVHGIGWHRWDGKRWARDGNGAARRAVHTVLRRERIKCEKLPIEERDRRAKQIARYETASAITGILTEAAVLQEFSVEVSDLDADPWLFNCANGTLDLRTAQLRPHDPADRVTKIAKAAYRPDTAGTEWAAFLEKVLPDEAVRDYVQRLIGLSLLGKVNGDKQIAPIAYGAGANGKTTFVEATCFAIGDYAMVAEPTLLMAKRGEAHPTGVADLLGKRFVSTAETLKGARFDHRAAQAAHRRRHPEGAVDAAGLLRLPAVPPAGHGHQPPARDRRRHRGRLAAHPGHSVHRRDPRGRARRAAEGQALRRGRRGAELDRSRLEGVPRARWAR